MNSDRSKINVPDVEEWQVDWNEIHVPIRIYRPEIEDDVPIFVYFHDDKFL